MNRYTIHCTAEQTKKALELGAPIESQSPMSNAPIVSYGETLNEYRKKVPKLYNCPTAEQMIGWLESEKLFSFDIRKRVITWKYFIYYNMRHSLQDPVLEDDGLDSRKEATLAAIDAALEYLENLKQ